MQNLPMPAMLVQVAQYLHGGRQRVGFPAGQNIAGPRLQLLEYLQKIPFAAAGGHVEQGEIIRQILGQLHPAQLFAQGPAHGVDILVHSFIGHLG